MFSTSFYIRINIKKALIPLVSCFVAYLRLYVADDDFLRRPNLKIRSPSVFALLIQSKKTGKSDNCIDSCWDNAEPMLS